MTTSDFGPSPAFYFAMPRLINGFFGGASASSENNRLEAYLGSIVILAIPYLLGVHLFLREARGWIALIAYPLLLLAVCAFWLLALYANSLVIKVIRACGFFRETPDRYLQDALVWLLIALFAGRLAISNSWIHWVGAVCLAALSLNVCAAVSLAVLNRSR
jgi:hypothetical protein